MRSKTTPLAVVLLSAAALGLAACSSSPSSSSGTSTSVTASPAAGASSSSTTTSTAAPALTGSGCTSLKGEQGTYASLSRTLGQAVAAGNLAAAKADLDAVMRDLQTDLSKAESDLGSLPSNVTAAFQVLKNFLSQVITQTAGATSLTQIPTIIVSLTTPQVKAASMTLTEYGEKLCGITTTTTSLP